MAWLPDQGNIPVFGIFNISAEVNKYIRKYTRLKRLAVDIIALQLDWPLRCFKCHIAKPVKYCHIGQVERIFHRWRDGPCIINTILVRGKNVGHIYIGSLYNQRSDTVTTTYSFKRINIGSGLE